MLPRTLVVGLGNPILADDGVGWHVIHLLRQTLLQARITALETITASVGGLALAELLADYDCAVIVDAMMTGHYAPGTVRQFDLTALPGTWNSSSSHDTNLKTALQTIRSLGINTPSDGNIHLIGIEALDVWTFAERCSPPVWQGIPLAVATLIQVLKEQGVVV